jgi:hypothetical protein
MVHTAVPTVTVPTVLTVPIVPTDAVPEVHIVFLSNEGAETAFVMCVLLAVRVAYMRVSSGDVKSVSGGGGGGGVWLGG